MALVIADRVKETTTTTGQGTVTLNGATTGYQTFAAVGNGNTTYYTIAGQGTSEWEVGIGTYTAAGTTLSRDTVLASSAGAPTKTTFTAGTKDVFVTYPSERAVDVVGNTIVANNMAATQGDLLYASATDTFSRLAKDANATRYLSNTGTTNNPAWAQISLTQGVSGTLPVLNGGTGVTTSTGSGNTVLSTSPTLTTPVFSSIVNTGTLTLPTSTDTLVARATTDTLTNKRVTPRVITTTSSATPTINTDNTDQYGLTAQAVDITSFTTNLSGTPTDGQKLWIYIVGTAARAITWGASFEASTVALPTTTVTTNRLDVGFVWNAATSKWRCVATA